MTYLLRIEALRLKVCNRKYDIVIHVAYNVEGFPKCHFDDSFTSIRLQRRISCESRDSAYGCYVIVEYVHVITVFNPN